MARAVRVRYAPSPTGFLHLGGLRTALYNYAFARNHGGKFILRIEDTDKKRKVPGSVEALVSALHWCGLDYDEGPDVGGPYGPYVQSERLHSYTAAAARMVSSGHAYRCFCSAERLDALRKSQEKRGRTPLYDRFCTRLPSGDSDRRAALGESHVIRLKVPPGASTVEDAVRGSVTFQHADVDDTVLLKSDGWPTYHLASVVDDTAMDISHVIRGQEWLPSTPKHLITYAALGAEPPLYAHLPILLNPDRSKLSKRSGDAAVEDFRAAGYLPQALVHFVALLGWTPPQAQAASILHLSDLCSSFRLSSVHIADGIVDRAKLGSLNGEHIRHGMAQALGTVHGSMQPFLPLELPDTPFLASLRSDVVPRLDAAIASVHAETPTASHPRTSGDGEVSGGQKDSPVHACTPVAHRVSVPRLNALLLSQHERVRPLSDFVDLCTPFLLSVGQGQGQGEAEWRAWMSRPAAATAATKIAAAGQKKSGQGTGAEDEAIPLSYPPLAHAVSRQRPALAAVCLAWEGLSHADWQDSKEREAIKDKEVEVEAVPLALAKASARASSHPGPGSILLPLRFILTGLDVGAGLSDTLRLLGRDEAIARLKWALALAHT